MSCMIPFLFFITAVVAVYPVTEDACHTYTNDQKGCLNIFSCAWCNSTCECASWDNCKNRISKKDYLCPFGDKWEKSTKSITCREMTILFIVMGSVLGAMFMILIATIFVRFSKAMIRRMARVEYEKI
jgi:hypothetical protein